MGMMRTGVEGDFSLDSYILWRRMQARSRMVAQGPITGGAAGRDWG